MIKKSVTFVDLDGKEQKGEFHFHMNKIEVMRLETKYGKDGGLEGYIKRITEEEDYEALQAVIEEIILGAYGRREGELFVKDAEETKAFEYSDAYGELVIGLLQNPKEQEEFFSNFISKKAPKPATRKGK